MKRKSQSRGQVLDLFLEVAEQLGITGDRDLAGLVGVSTETVSNWRTGAVQEVKPQKLAAMKAGLSARIAALRDQARELSETHGMIPVEIEEESGPAELQRQFRDRIHYDYLGHRFLYYDPQGALAWEVLIGTGYDQERWLKGTADCALKWFDVGRDARGRAKGILGRALGLDRAGRVRGVDIISLGPGEGGKEVRILDHLIQVEEEAGKQLPFLTMVEVDVSIPLLMKATQAARSLLSRGGELRSHVSLRAVCADFEEGPLRFVERLPTAQSGQGDSVRLVLLLGNNFGNLRDEEAFIHQRLWKLMRPGDYAWIEVGIRPENIEDEPLYRLTQPGYEETAADTCRRLLLSGPYRRWEAALGRASIPLELKVWLREDDESTRVPGSCNFCHDLVLSEENRVCSALYSRRYRIDELASFLRARGLEVENVVSVEDSRGRPRVAHFLTRRR